MLIGRVCAFRGVILGQGHAAWSCVVCQKGTIISERGKPMQGSSKQSLLHSPVLAFSLLPPYKTARRRTLGVILADFSILIAPFPPPNREGIPMNGWRYLGLLPWQAHTCPPCCLTASKECWKVYVRTYTYQYFLDFAFSYFAFLICKDTHTPLPKGAFSCQGAGGMSSNTTDVVVSSYQWLRGHILCGYLQPLLFSCGLTCL